MSATLLVLALLQPCQAPETAAPPAATAPAAEEAAHAGPAKGKCFFGACPLHAHKPGHVPPAVSNWSMTGMLLAATGGVTAAALFGALAGLSAAGLAADFIQGNNLEVTAQLSPVPRLSGPWHFHTLLMAGGLGAVGAVLVGAGALLWGANTHFQRMALGAE